MPGFVLIAEIEFKSRNWAGSVLRVARKCPSEPDSAPNEERSLLSRMRALREVYPITGPYRDCNKNLSRALHDAYICRHREEIQRRKESKDEKICQVLSRRMKDCYDISGGLPDTIEDDWIETVEKLEEMMNEYIHLRQKARDVFEMRYQETIDPARDRWELCSRVLSRRDVVDRLSIPW